ncbi:MAG: Gfo/Idh/MocA family oxidoreductase [Bdellovibrionales bacterium]|nr:Gfo/Idh/MocA family oxidoreductase [Bdellovibrionales bacterium]
MKRVRVAQLGVGYWGPNLLRNLVSNPNVDIAGVVDLSEERRQFVGSKYPMIPTSSELSFILNDSSIDAVVIATPANSHCELAKKCLAAGKHVLVEKPLGRSVTEVREIARIANENNRVAMVGHTFVFNSAVAYLKNLIDSGELGQVRYIYSQRLNLGRIRSDIDALWNLAPHDVSIVQYLFGDPKPLSVKRSGMDYVQRGIDDVVFLNIVYPNRVMVNIHVSWLDPSKTRKMVVVGSDKMVVYDDAADHKISIYDKGIDRMAMLGENMDYDHPQPFNFTHRAGDVYTPRIEYIEPLQTEIQHFLDCIVDGVECRTGPDHALRVVEILESSEKEVTRIHVVEGLVGHPSITKNAKTEDEQAVSSELNPRDLIR